MRDRPKPCEVPASQGAPHSLTYARRYLCARPYRCLTHSPAAEQGSDEPPWKSAYPPPPREDPSP